eukprot:TRINITY_DN75855_c0_g1_i1.p1 TRINITY_DN75855_c0_g1~~TRINITY_DN75855_c0_g1_i1.p1  ORF type:complete len:2288 (+),score=377.63 TRINITY_DN75855_c0_g1_i1:75-6866(+)
MESMEESGSLHWKSSLQTGWRSATPDSRAQTPNVRWPPPDMAGSLGFRGSPSRTPTPLHWARDLGNRSITPGSCVTAYTGSLARGAALEMHARSTSVAGCYSARGDSRAASSMSFADRAQTPQPVPLSARERTESGGSFSKTPDKPGGSFKRFSYADEVDEKKMREARMNRLMAEYGGDMRKAEEHARYEVLFRRAPPTEDEVEESRIMRSQPAPPGAVKATSQAETELMMSVVKSMDAYTIESAQDRKPYGGRIREPRPALSPPAQLAAPDVQPHNAWCTFIHWIPPADGSDSIEFSYEINVRSHDSEHSLTVTDLGTEPMAQLNGLEAGKTYYFQVRARNELGAGEWSNWSRGYTPPSPPSKLARQADGTYIEPTSHSDSPHSAKLEWDEPCSQGAPVVGYKIEYGEDPTDPSTIETITSLHRRTYVIVDNLKPTHTYVFRVQALNQVGHSDWSDWSTAIATKAVEPEVPSEPMLVEAGSMDLTITWDEPYACGVRIDRYDVLVGCEDPEMQNAVLIKGSEESVGTRTMKLQHLSPLSNYFFQVRAVSAVGMSGWSIISKPCKTLQHKPCKCQDLQVTGNELGQVSLQWKAPESYKLPIKKFIVRWSGVINEAGGMQNSKSKEVQPPPGTTLGTVVTCDVTGLEPGSKLFFQVAAQSEAGRGPFCDSTHEVACMPSTPSKPKAPYCKEQTSTSFMIRVEDVANPHGSPVLRYELCYDSKQSMVKPVKFVGPMKVVEEAVAGKGRILEYAATGFRSRGPWYFAVRCYNASGPSEWSEPSKPCLLKLNEPLKMAGVTLKEADSPHSLRLNYVQAADLGAKFGGSISEYEMRYARYLKYLDDPEAGHYVKLNAGDTSEHKVCLVRWPAPAHGLPPPVQVKGLATGREYYFQIRAVSPHGIGPWSFASPPFMTLPSRPEKPVPAGVEQGALNPYSAKLLMTLPESNGAPVTQCRLRYLGPNWKNCPPVTEWKELKYVISEDCEIYTRPRREDEDWELATEKQITSWEFTVLHLEPGAAYRFMFSCINDAGESEMSDISNAVVTMPTVPDKCEAPIVLSDEDVTDSTAKLSWKAPHDGGADITHYTFIWASNMRFQGAKVIENVVEANYMLTDLEPNEKYYARVAAHNSMGQGKFSDCIPHLGQGIAGTTPRTPAQVREIHAEAITHLPGAALLKWMKPADEGGTSISRYRIIYADNSKFSQPAEVMRKAMRETRLHDLKPDTSYWFKVQAINAVGAGPWSKTVSAHTMPVPPQKSIPPKTPNPPNLEIVSENGCWVLKVDWECPEKYDRQKGFIYDEENQTHMITHYSVYMQGGHPDPHMNDHEELKEFITQNRDRRTVPRNIFNATKFQDLIPGRYYYAIVKAFSDAGESEWSLPSEVLRTPPGIPDDVAEVSCCGTTTESVAVKWNCPGGNGEQVTHFSLRLREERVLRGWKDGNPAMPEESEPNAGQYEYTGTWSEEILLPNPEVNPDLELVKNLSVLEDGTLRYECWDLQPASFYEIEVWPHNIVGKGGTALSGLMKTRSTLPGPPGRCFGIPELADVGKVTFRWTVPTYTGGEDIIGYEVRWLVNVVDTKPPHSLETYLSDGPEVTKLILGPDVLEHTVEGLHPGDAALAVVRCYTEVGHSGWCRIPYPEDVEGFSSKPDVPAVIDAPPVMERMPNDVDHRQYSLKVSWTCPDVMGRPIQHFNIQLVRSDTEADLQAIRASGKIAPPPGFDEVHDFTVVKPRNRDWVPGETVEIRCIHQALTPGTPYVAHVIATNEVGTARGWGPQSLPAVAPPDYPSQPEPPFSPFSWPQALEIEWAEPWTKGSDLVRCELWISEDATMANPREVPSEVANKHLDTREVHVDGLEFATYYYLKLRVKNGVGWSPWSRVSEGFLTGACRPAQPKAPKLLDIDMESMRVMWFAPNNHGAEIDKYEIFLADQERVPFVQKLVADMNLAEVEEDRLQLLENLPPKDDHTLMVEEFENTSQPEHIFEGLLGGLDYAVAVRAHNREGWSDWSLPNDTIRSPTAAPVESPAPWILEASQTTLKVGFSIPYDNGDPITSAKVSWFRICGPMERHLALGGKATDTKGQEEAHEGFTVVSFWPGQLARAPPEGIGGSSEALLEGLAPGTEYDVQVCAINSHGPGMESVAMRFLSAPGRPDRPSRMRHCADNDAGRSLMEPAQSSARSAASGAPKEHFEEDVPLDAEAEMEEAMKKVADGRDQEEEASSSRGGAIFFKRTAMMAQDQVVRLKPNASNQGKTSIWKFPNFRGKSSPRVQPQ